MIKPATVLSFAAAMLGTSPAHATKCSRWNNQLATCDVVNLGDCSEPEETWTWGVRNNWYNWLYSSTPQKACRKQIMKWHPGEEATALAVQVTSDYYLCYFDWDRDGSALANEAGEDDDMDGADDDDYNGVSSVWLNTDIDREPECDLVPQGPYTTVSRLETRPPVRPVAGGKFSQDQRYWITDKNRAKYGNSMRSDASSTANPVTGIGDDEAIWVTRFTLPPYEDDPEFDEPFQKMPDQYSQAQVDHIIPRMDIHGCGCGTNGYNNAAVISGNLNRSMSNNLRDPDRIKMLQAFVPGYVPPALAPGVDDDGEEVTLADRDVPAAELGGCSSTPRSSAIGMLGLVGLALVVRRRRARA